MAALFIGLIFILFGVWSVLPFDFPMGLNWGEYVLSFLMGGGPLLAFFIGLIAFLIGIADIKDKAEEKKADETKKE